MSGRSDFITPNKWTGAVEIGQENDPNFKERKLSHVFQRLRRLLRDWKTGVRWRLLPPKPLLHAQLELEGRVGIGRLKRVFLCKSSHFPAQHKPTLHRVSGCGWVRCCREGRSHGE